MKRSRITRAVAIVAAIFSCTIPLEAGATESVEQWGIHEVTLTGPRDGNPFVDVELGAIFSKDQQTIKVGGFYDGDGVYRIRFMPESTGTWSYRTTSNRAELADKSGELKVTPPSPGNRGPVRVAHTYHFSYADGATFRPFGTTCYGWLQRPEQLQEQTLKTLYASPFNKVRMLLMPQNQEPELPAPPSPFEGTPPKEWDFTRYNPDFFQHFEKRIGQLRDLGIECDLILFHPYGRMWGMDDMDDANDDRYLRYVVARLSAYRNVWWSLANEYDFLRWKQTADWDRFLQIVQHSDPYGHLRSIHNGYEIYNATSPWITHASIQCGGAVEDSGRAELLRSAFRKPVVYDEVKYEGNIDKRWGQLDGRELIHRVWSGTVIGTYVGHGEALKDSTGSWLSKGGTFRGESPARITFLRKILEEAPAGGIDPIDKWQQPAGLGGKPGHYYLLYFGREAPKSWVFELYKSGLREGMQFQAEVIDTWEMTVTAVPGTFVTKRKDAYHFTDQQQRSIDLPGKPGIALRINRIGDTSGDPVIEEPNE
jgi:hypothetical protein